ncbi:site-specific integrase [Sphingomonas sp. CARO-RG-8B-R24-01]|uniref:site-specific integrase n=1 Tax=Sphingomonas sp. CARO-RG-8B-R24-01 TaxID=2914831 RepID=UPI001F59D54C
MADEPGAGRALVGPAPMLEAPVLPAVLEAEVDAARGYAAASRAASTRRAYLSDWSIFTAWCDSRGIEPLPARPAAVATFLAAEAEAGVKTATIGRRLAAIGYMHRAQGFDAPQACVGAQAIRDVLAGIRRTHGVRKGKKRAADADMLRDMLHGIEGDSPRAVRDRALLAIGMAGAFRRSELVALQLDEVAMVPEGIRILIGRSKTDQEGAGAEIAIPEGSRIRPKQLLLAWVTLAGFADGPVFRKLTPQGRITAKPMSDRGVALVVKARAQAAGYDPEQVAGHSLRAGFLTEAARRGANIFKMREQSRHKSLEVLSDYVRNHELFADHAGERFL